MKRRHIAVLLVVALMLVPTVALGVVRGSPDLMASAPDNRIVAGETTNLEVTLSNRGDLDTGSAQNPSLNQEVTNARSVEARLQAGGAPVDVRTGTRLVSSLQEGQSVELPYQLVVDDDAEPGEYDMELVVQYDHYSVIGESEGARNERTVNQTFDVTVDVDERADFEIVDVDTDLQIGSSGTVAVTMRNNGSDAARDTTVDLESASGDLTFGEASSSSRYVGYWEAGETETVEYRVRASDEAEEQRYTFRATASFEDSDGVTRESDPLRLGVTPLPEADFGLSGVSGELRVGEEQELSGTITNDGDTTARDAVVRYTTENENIEPAEREYSVGTLESGESAQFQHELDISSAADAGARQFSYVVEYRDEDGDTLTSDELVVRQEVMPERDTFSVDIVEGQVEQGGSSDIQVEVTNQGNETLSDISAKLFSNDPIATGDDEAYVTELAPGESATIEFSLSASSSALAKSYPISVDFQYDDEGGDTQLSNTYRMPVTVTEPEDGDGTPLALIGGVVLVALVAIAGYMRLR